MANEIKTWTVEVNGKSVEITIIVSYIETSKGVFKKVMRVANKVIVNGCYDIEKSFVLAA